MSDAFQFGALVGRVKQASPAHEFLKRLALRQLLGTAGSGGVGAAIGAYAAPKGHKVEGAGRGAAQGAGAWVGSGLGGLFGATGGMAAGGALGAGVGKLTGYDSLDSSVVGGGLGGFLGMLGGEAYGGYKGVQLANKLMGPASYDKKANVYDAGQATSQIKPKPCCTNKSNIGQLTGQVSSNNPGQQGKSAGVLGPADNGMFSDVIQLGNFNNDPNSTMNQQRASMFENANRVRSMLPVQFPPVAQYKSAVAHAARAAAMKAANFSEYARYVPAGLAAGTGIGALAGLATSRKGKRLRGLARGALLGGGTGFGVDVGAALGVLPGMGAGAGAGAGLGAALGAGGGYLSGARGNDLAESTGLGALGGLMAGVPIGGAAGIIGGGYLGGRTGHRLVRKALDKRDEDDAE